LPSPAGTGIRLIRLSFYGVSSRELSKGLTDEVGLNKGLGDLATGAEVLTYFDDVMRHQFLPTGRVQYFPMCDYEGGSFTSKLTGETHTVKCKKIVDATYLNTSVPSTHTPNFSVAEGLQFMALNDLPHVTVAPAGYVVIGGGKTGIDACLWLLEQGIDPDKICWIKSRDAWLIDRANTQPTMEFFEATIGAQANQFEAIGGAKSMHDMFDRLEASGFFLRLDPDVRPTMFHAATVSQLELVELRKIKNIVRLGRVTSVEADQIVLDGGTVPTTADHLYVDCSASAITGNVPKPVFEGDLITPQTVRAFQPVFSGAFIAHIEATRKNEEEKNAVTAVVPLPNGLEDFLHMTAANLMNQYVWGQDKELGAWLRGNRLDAFSALVGKVDPEDPADADKLAVLMRLKDSAMPAMGMLQHFIAAL